jgi:hypothetical protein
MDVINAIVERPYQNKDTNRIAKKIAKQALHLCALAETLVKYNVNDSESNQRKLLVNIADDGDIRYHVLPGYINYELTICDVFSIQTGLSALYFDFVQLVKEKAIMRICSNCRKYFIPSSRSDEIYCNNRNPNGKTCKEIGYENKVKNDAVLSEYRKIYKTQNARKQRNRGHIEDIDNRFSRWTEFAKKKLKDCQEEKITLDEMVRSIVTDDWMKERRGMNA